MKRLKNYTKLFTIFIITIFILSGCKSSKLPDSKNISNNSGIKISYINVGQGDSSLIQVNGKNMLIDAGPNDNTDKLISFLEKQNIKKLDYVIATHPHEDHIGAMDSVIDKYDVAEFYAPRKTSGSKTFESMAKSLKSKNLKITPAKAGLNIDLGENTKCEMLAPNGNKYEDDNNYSAVIKISYGDSKFLFTGDAEKISEKEMLDKKFNLSSDVLKVGHHGSTSSSSKAFLDKVNPKIAIISCGKGNSYHHPHKQTVDEFKKRNTQVYRTDIDDTITITSDGKNIKKQ